MVNFNAYLQSISETYTEWWKCYTITDVVGKQRDEQKGHSATLPRSPLFDFGLMVETVKREQEEKTERLTVLEGLRKYADNHVLLIGRPGSGKSTALLRLLVETAPNHLEPRSLALPGNALLGGSASVYEAEPHSLGSQPEARNELNELKGVGGLGQIPILIELRFYKTSIIDLIRDFLKRHQLLLEISEIERLLFERQFLLLVDGVNELPSEAARQDLQKFRQDYRNTTPMIFTTRDLGVGGDLGIEKKLQMQPLTETQMREFVCGYLPQGEEMLKQLSGRLRELGETPLLLMMLCSVFRDNQNKVPSNLGSVFRHFTEIYDRKLKQDIPVTDESRRWWKRLLQHLAWVMTKGESKTEILVTIPIQEARDILTKFLKEQDYHQPRDAEAWLDDLLKHHLIQLGAENQIEFRHQLLQEYYAAERLLEEITKLSNDDLQWEYLNYLKWTEVVALMMQLVDKQSQAVRLVKLALGIDWQLGARLAGEVREEWQEETVGLVDGLEIPLLLKIRLLDQTKSEAATPTLIPLLEHKDSIVRLYGVEAIRKLKSKAAIPYLYYVLEDKSFSVRNSVISTLGEIGSDAVTPVLITSIKNNNSNSIASNAVKALGKIGSKKAVNALIRELQNRDYIVRTAAVEALGQIGTEAAITALITSLQDKNSSVRWYATIALGQIHCEKAIPALITLLLKDKKDSVRRGAASALAKIGSEAAISLLIQILKDKNSDNRVTAASALTKAKSETAILTLIKLLKDEDPFIRRTALKALAKAKGEAAIHTLIQALEDEDSSVRQAAVWTLAEAKDEAVIPNLIKALEDEDSSVRLAAVSVLGEKNSIVSIYPLITALQDDNDSVRCYAIEALGKIAFNTSSSNALIKALQDKNYHVRKKTVEALGNIKSESAIPYLIKILQQEDEKHSVRCRSATALGQIGSKIAVPALIIALQNESRYSPNISSFAASALGSIGSETAIPALTKAEQSTNHFLRSSASDALLIILSKMGSFEAIFDLVRKFENDWTRENAFDCLYEIGSESIIIQLIIALQEENFVQANNGDALSDGLLILQYIQQHLKYYKPIPKPTMSNTSHNYALLIGVGECEETKLSLPVTVKDIQAVKSLLTDSNLCGYIDNNIRLLYNETATKEKILQNLNWLKQQAKNDPEATILIYYSGHGCLDNSGDYYLIPHETDRADIPNTALSAETINQALQEIPAQRLLVIIDSCHAQGMATSKDDAGNNKRSPIPKGFTQTALPKTIIDNFKGAGRVVFTSSTGEQLSWIRSDRTMSIYTYHFLEALQGAANQPGDKLVKVSHLMNYLSETVPIAVQKEYQKEQTPFFDFATEDFPVALLLGGKGLPAAGYDVKAEAEENIRNISNKVNDGVGIVGDGNSVISIVGSNNSVGNISSK
ncbi:MAG: HEAT repeat domain-containing protein [Rivularia sp. (in: cyanobacteria)]